MSLHDILSDIHALEEDLLFFERKYGIRSETLHASYISGEEPEDDSWGLDFGEWASNYKTWLVRQADYRRAYPGERMNNPLHTPEDYELFLYTLTEKFPSVRRSTVTFARRGATLARVAGELFFDMEFRIVVRERICYQRIPSSMDGLVQ